MTIRSPCPNGYRTVDPTGPLDDPGRGRNASTRGSPTDRIATIVSVGEARVLALRPRPGGSSGPVSSTVRYPLGHGDLIVMGGSCQRTWEHAIPKASGRVGPRISIQFRPRGVR